MHNIWTEINQKKLQQKSLKIQVLQFFKTKVKKNIFLHIFCWILLFMKIARVDPQSIRCISSSKRWNFSWRKRLSKRFIHALLSRNLLLTTKVSKFAGVGWALMSCWIKAKCFVSFDHPFNDISVQLKAQRFTDYNERDVVPVWEDETFWEKQQKKKTQWRQKQH